MKTKIKKVTTIELILSEEEAKWLRDIMQNNILLAKESAKDKEMREKFFTSLNIFN